MILVFLGPPGVGKGTQAKLLSQAKGIAHISTGDMLRAATAAGTKLGKEVKEIIDSGNLVSDELMIQLIKQRIGENDCKSGYILDGFPRTLNQAKALEILLQQEKQKLDAVIYFELSEADLLNRLANRREQEGRVDDSIEVQKERLRVYQEKTSSLVDFYRNNKLLKTIPSTGTVEQVQEEVLRSVG